MKTAFFSIHNFERDSILKANNNHHKMVFIEEMLSEKTIKLAKDCKAICIFINDNSDALVLKKLNEIGIKHIALRSAGYNHVDLIDNKPVRGMNPLKTLQELLYGCAMHSRFQ